MDIISNYKIPEKVYNYYTQYISSKYLDNIWNRLIRCLLEEKDIPTTLLIKESNNPEYMSEFIYTMCNLEYLESRIDLGYARCYLNKDKFLKKLHITEEEFIKLIQDYKYHKYLMRNIKSYENNLTKSLNHTTNTGLIRNGFLKASNHTFRYDTRYIKKYLPYITRHLWKGLSSTTKDVSYQEIIETILKYSSMSNSEYTLEQCITDSRGRAIFQCVKRIFNPIASKDARSIIICPKEELSLEGEQYVYTFIAELCGYLGKNFKDKIRLGKKCYKDRVLPSLEEMKTKKDYDKLHERIWLERIYENLDNLKYSRDWIVPIEMDCRCSAIQIIGLLTNNHLYLDETNLINPNEFKDFWTIKDIPRRLVKKAATPLIYGSSMKPRELWTHYNLEYTDKQVVKMNYEVEQGKLSYAEEFKNCIINNVKFNAINTVNIWNDTFKVYCNKFKENEESLEKYNVWNSVSKKFTLLYRKEKNIPDLNRFKTYSVTLLI